MKAMEIVEFLKQWDRIDNIDGKMALTLTDALEKAVAMLKKFTPESIEGIGTTHLVHIDFAYSNGAILSATPHLIDEARVLLKELEG
jgi:hypothetical protein